MYRDTVTVFNRVKTKNGDVWYPKILRGVNLNKDRGAIVAKYGEESQDNAILNVRLNGSKVGEYDYYTPVEWQRLEDKTNAVTFAPEDFFYEGEWTGSSPAADENYGDLSFFEYMTKNFDFVYKITTIGYFSVIPHIEVAGR